jgi:hypothetical protein
MPDVPFHLTRNGRLFYERTMPELVRQLGRMNELLERLVAAQDARDREPGPAEPRSDQAREDAP